MPKVNNNRQAANQNNQKSQADILAKQQKDTIRLLQKIASQNAQILNIKAKQNKEDVKNAEINVKKYKQTTDISAAQEKYLKITKDELLLKRKEAEYQNATLKGKKDIIASEKAAQNEKMKGLMQEQKTINLMKSKIEKEPDAEIRKALQDNINIKSSELDSEIELLKSDMAKTDDRLGKLQASINKGASKDATKAEKKAYQEQKREDANMLFNSARSQYKENITNGVSQEESNRQLNASMASVADTLKDGNIFDKMSSKVIGGITNMATDALGFGKIADALDKISDVANALYDAADESVNSAMNTFSRYMGSIDARLQGVDDLSFNGIVNNLNKTFSGSKLMKATDYLDTLAKLTEKGIAYNLEQRSLIATLGDKLVTTFDAANENLLRLVRLQQSDMTYSQLGSEASLTQFLNSTFQDTSYLSNVYDSTESSLIEALSQMSKDAATSFEYAVQKWLGSLYSVGMSSQGISTITEGLTALATGDYAKLSGNQQLQTLMAMSAQKAGLSYTELLTKGLNFNDVNALMKAMITYLQDIAQNTGDQVTKSAYSNILNMSLSDIRAVQNLSNSDIATIYGSNMTYASAMASYNSQMKAVSDRLTVAEKVDNTISNLLYNFGASIADNDTQYIMWKANGILKDVGEMFGSSESGSSGILSRVVKWVTGISSSINLAVGLVETLGDFATSTWRKAKNGGVAEFDWSEWTSRGTDYSGIEGVSLADIVTGISYSATTNNNSRTNSSEASTVSFLQNANAVTLSGSTIVSSDEVAAVRTVSDIYAQLFDNQRPLRVILSSIEAMANESIISNINSSSVASGEGSNILENTKKTTEILEEKLDTPTSTIAESITNHLVEVRYY